MTQTLGEVGEREVPAGEKRAQPFINRIKGFREMEIYADYFSFSFLTGVVSKQTFSSPDVLADADNT